MALHEPSIALPSLVSSSLSFDNLLVMDDDDDNDNGWSERVNGSSQFQETQAGVNLVHYNVDHRLEEGPSMTLRDILLQADTTQFDLLGKTSFSQAFAMVLNSYFLFTDVEDPADLGNRSFEWD